MKIAAYISIPFLLASLSGCSLLARPGLSVDGLGRNYLGDASSLALMAADELARRYPPAHTQLTLARVPGAFGDALENDLRTRGYAVAENTVGALSIQYTVDELTSDAAGEFMGGRSGYVRMRMSDGQEFSFVRKLGTMVPVIPLEPVNSPVKTSLTPEKESLGIPASDTAMSSVNVTPLSPSSAPPKSVSMATSIDVGTPTWLANGVLTSLPANWRYTIPDSSRRSVRVSKSNALSWRERIQNMAEQAGCAASFDESARRVTIIAYDDAPVPLVPLVAMESSEEPAHKAVMTELPEPSPVVSTALAEFALPTSVMPTPSLSVITSPLSPLSPAVAEEWKLAPGSLESQLRGWANRAQWELLWKAEHDIMLHSHAVLRGSFTEVVGQLFQGLSIQGNSLRITFYSVNNVVEVKED